MGRAVLLVGAAAWGLAAVAALLVSAFGIERLLALLPPLAIDAEAVGGAVLAVGLALAIAAAAHLAILVGLARGARLARTAGLLLCSLGVAVTIGLAASAFASAAADASMTVPLVVAGVASLVAAFGYAGGAAWFMGAIRDAPGPGGGV